MIHTAFHCHYWPSWEKEKPSRETCRLLLSTSRNATDHEQNTVTITPGLSLIKTKCLARPSTTTPGTNGHRSGRPRPERQQPERPPQPDQERNGQQPQHAANLKQAGQLTFPGLFAFIRYFYKILFLRFFAFFKNNNFIVFFCVFSFPYSKTPKKCIFHYFFWEFLQKLIGGAIPVGIFKTFSPRGVSYVFYCVKKRILKRFFSVFPFFINHKVKFYLFGSSTVAILSTIVFTLCNSPFISLFSSFNLFTSSLISFSLFVSKMLICFFPPFYSGYSILFLIPNFNSIFCVLYSSVFSNSLRLCAASSCIFKYLL